MSDDNNKAEAVKKVEDAVQTKPAETAKPQPKVEKGLEKIDRDYIEREALNRAKEMGISYIDVSKTPINPDLLRIIDPEEAKKGMIVPFFRIGKRLRVAVADPNKPETKRIIEDLKKQKYLINVNLASEEGIKDALKLYESDQYKVKTQLESKYKESEVKAYEKELVELADLKERIEDATSEEGLQLINVGAVKTGASDIHYEPEEKDVRIRFRIDGVLHTVFRLDSGTYKNLSNQLKYACKMKLNITNIPQDGRYSFVLNERKIDVRVSSIPTHYGESFVCRLLDSSKGVMDFEEMGFENEHLKKMQKLKKMNNGMILCTGPTGAGKTSTLYSVLNQFNSPETKIITLEDPVEYNIQGVSQSQINEKRDYTFASGMKSVLRQDPDVVMIGEVRDLDTAQTASQASLTGHVVLSTLHTNSAVETIPRLINMGLPAFMVAPSLHTIIAQRLVRKLCDNCKVMKSIPAAELKGIEKNIEAMKKIKSDLEVEIPKKLPYAAGCDQCSHTGYKGRLAISEIITVDYEIRDLILKEQSSNTILLALRRKGFISMREDGVLKVLKGLSSLEEVFRVTSVSM